MKNNIFKLTALVLFTFIVAVNASLAQAPKRIDFAKEGSNSLVWEQKVEANASKSFVFKATKGQVLTLSFIDDTKKGMMELGKESIEPNADPYQANISVTKDYTFTVKNNSAKKTSFRIAISLEDVKAKKK